MNNLNRAAREQAKLARREIRRLRWGLLLCSLGFHRYNPWTTVSQTIVGGTVYVKLKRTCARCKNVLGKCVDF